MWAGVWFATCWSYLVANNASVKVSRIRILLQNSIVPAYTLSIESNLSPMAESWTVSALCHAFISNGEAMDDRCNCCNVVKEKWHVMYLGIELGQKHGFPLSFQLKLRGASMEAGQVCWGFIFYLLVIPLKWPSQPARRHKGCWSELQTEGHTGCWLRSEQASPSLLSK